MRISLLGVALAAGGLLMVAPVSCVGSDTAVNPSTGADGGSSGNTGDGGTGCGGKEICGNKIDDNCNGQVDEGCDCDAVHEGTNRACGQDGPGTCTLGTQTCNAGQWSTCTGVLPTMGEQACDGKDEDCNGQIDDGLTITCLHDLDHDGYPNPDDKKDVCPDATAAAAPRYGCPVDYIRDTQSPGSDCKDGDPTIHPKAVQLCDKTDWDCDGKLRNGCPSSTATLGTATHAQFGIVATTSGCGTQVYESHTTTCPSGAANGFYGFWGGSFTAPTQMGLVCNAGIITETVNSPEYLYGLSSNGPNNNADLAGPGRTDDTNGTASCDAGQWVVGFKWTASCLFDRVKIMCAPITYLGSGPSWKATTGTTTDKYVLGNSSTTAADNVFQCPSGSVVSSVTEWNTTGSLNDANYISAFDVACTPLGFVPQ
jgi:hypothetical protein